jgi:hypothetical protein
MNSWLSSALERTRTSTPKGHRPSTYRVCQFRHQGIYSYYNRGGIPVNATRWISRFFSRLGA